VINFTPSRFTPGERATSIHRIGSWVNPRAGLDAVAKRKKFHPLPGIEHRVIQPVAQSLYWLSYCGSQNYVSNGSLLKNNVQNMTL
jgi:hypothetical protein